MTDFLLELRSEEIPARMQAKARDDLARLFAAELAKAGLNAAETLTYATPRRLALIARGLPDGTAAVSEEVKGPRSSAPPQALEGFLRKTGLTREQLSERDGVLYAVTEKPGRATAGVLADAIPAVIRAFPWPKSMRWGEASASTESLRWVRPMHGIVALFGEEIVPVEIAGVTSGAATLGHRFHHPGPITIGGAHDYVEKLRACHVIVDQDERAAIVREGAARLAAEAGLRLVEDEGLVAENAGLTEWPVPLLGRFDAGFLDVPAEVIQLTARVNQKYFVLRNADPSDPPDPPRNGEGDRREAVVEGLGQDFASPSDPRFARATSPSRGGTALAPAFICTANIAAPDGGARIVEGNRKVLAARLSDARFFYEQDLRVPLEEQAKKLDRIVFHEKLGTVADKVERLAKLARWLVEEGIVQSSQSSPERGGGPARSDGGGAGLAEPSTAPSPSTGFAGPPPLAGEDLADLAERAARLCKADLVTGMVGEFPELQGVMGGYYAAAQGEDPRLAAAIRDHYKPVGQGDEIPTAPVTVAVSLADKLDSLYQFFAIGEPPTGSKDPFALRRAALSITAVIVRNGLRAPLRAVLARLGEIEDEGFRAGPEGAWMLKYGMGEEDVARHDFGEDYSADRGFQLWSLFDTHQRTLRDELLTFFADRLKVQQREAGVRHDLIDAVFAAKNKDGAGEDDLVRLLARVRALQAFMATEDGANLLTGYRRAANILKKEGFAPLPEREGLGVGPGTHDGIAKGLPTPDPSLAGRGASNSLSYTPEPAEHALIAALDSAEPRAAEAVAAEDFEGAMAALASLRAPIDAFFDSVTVNDPDTAKRSARLALLARMRDAVHAVADFSRIEG